ncbi:hypothetical protein HPB47_008954 [Ixodes persulcatus]|uniref:Uncharacterized protein n=1 Tax=Ixodes persulcatus TaxID=34615 RepID=A0AC60P3A4_IXOPE|nr:hypothetical protein HPB47_008954 [Ixodes persulcatus]
MRSMGTLELDIEIDNVVCLKVKVIVVNDSALSVDMLVGSTWTEQDHIAYLRMGDELRIGYRDDHPFCDINLAQMNPSKEPLRVKETMVLPKRTVCWVTVETACFSPSPSEAMPISSPASTADRESNFPDFHRLRFHQLGIWQQGTTDAIGWLQEQQPPSHHSGCAFSPWKRAFRLHLRKPCRYLHQLRQRTGKAISRISTDYAFTSSASGNKGRLTQ